MRIKTIMNPTLFQGLTIGLSIMLIFLLIGIVTITTYLCQGFLSSSVVSDTAELTSESIELSGDNISIISEAQSSITPRRKSDNYGHVSREMSILSTLQICQEGDVWKSTRRTAPCVSGSEKPVFSHQNSHSAPDLREICGEASYFSPDEMKREIEDVAIETEPRFADDEVACPNSPRPASTSLTKVKIHVVPRTKNAEQAIKGEAFARECIMNSPPQEQRICKKQEDFQHPPRSPVVVLDNAKRIEAEEGRQVKVKTCTAVDTNEAGLCETAESYQDEIEDIYSVVHKPKNVTDDRRRLPAQNSETTMCENDVYGSWSAITISPMEFVCKRDTIEYVPKSPSGSKKQEPGGFMSYLSSGSYMSGVRMSVEPIHMSLSQLGVEPSLPDDELKSYPDERENLPDEDKGSKQEDKENEKDTPIVGTNGRQNSTSSEATYVEGLGAEAPSDGGCRYSNQSEKNDNSEENNNDGEAENIAAPLTTKAPLPQSGEVAHHAEHQCTQDDKSNASYATGVSEPGDRTSHVNVETQSEEVTDRTSGSIPENKEPSTPSSVKSRIALWQKGSTTAAANADNSTFVNMSSSTPSNTVVNESVRVPLPPISDDPTVSKMDENGEADDSSFQDEGEITAHPIEVSTQTDASRGCDLISNGNGHSKKVKKRCTALV